MMRRPALGLLGIVLASACGGHVPGPVLPAEEVGVEAAPPAVVTAALERLATAAEARHAVLAGDAGPCFNVIAERTFAALTDTLAPPARTALASCAATGPSRARHRDPVSPSGTVVQLRSATRSFRATPGRPEFFLSRAGVDRDSTVAVVEARYYCGTLCEGTLLLWFRRVAGEWRVATTWSLWLS